MNIQRIPEHLLRWVVTVGGIGLALYLAKSLGDGKTGMVVSVLLGILGVIVALLLREKIWILIPTFWPLIGKMTILPVAFTVKDITTMYVFAVVLTLLAFKIIRRAPKLAFIDLLFIVNALWLLSTFIRNPVGFEIFGSQRLGGRPYFDALIGCLALWVLGRMSGSVRLIRLLPILTVSSVGAVFLLNVVVEFVPNLAPIFSQFYSGLDLGSYNELDQQLQVDRSMTGRRYEMFRDIGRYMSIFLCAYSYPPQLLLPFRLRFYAAVATLAGLLLSGFRSFLIYAAGMFFIGTWFRKNLSKAVLYVTLAFGILLFALIGQGTMYELPFAAQRALGFLPKALIAGKLDPYAVEAGTSSTEWRTQMWMEALTTNRFIENHNFGDGFGFSKREYQAIAAMSQRQAFSYEETQQTMAVVGDFHSGPISSIRVTGYVGLALVAALFLVLARDAMRLVRRSKATPFFAPTLFFCLPIIFEPFWYFFIFGGHAAVIPFTGFGLGIMKVIQNSLDQWETEGAKSKTPQLGDVTPALADSTPLVNS